MEIGSGLKGIEWRRGGEDEGLEMVSSVAQFKSHRASRDKSLYGKEARTRKKRGGGGLAVSAEPL